MKISGSDVLRRNFDRLSSGGRIISREVSESDVAAENADASTVRVRDAARQLKDPDTARLSARKIGGELKQLGAGAFNLSTLEPDRTAKLLEG